jgi:hypothetical protein
MSTSPPCDPILLPPLPYQLAQPTPQPTCTPLSNQLKQQPAAIIAVLCEPTSHLEGSISAQCSQAVAELDAEAAACADPSIPSAAAPLRPQKLLPLLGLRLARLGYVVHVRCTSSTGTQQPAAAAAAAAAATVPPPQQQQPAAADHHNHNTPHQQQQAQAQAGRHAFLVVQQPEELTCPVVVDCDFAPQFGLSSGDKRYQEVVAALPRVLVMQVRFLAATVSCASPTRCCMLPLLNRALPHSRTHPTNHSTSTGEPPVLPPGGPMLRNERGLRGPGPPAAPLAQPRPGGRKVAAQEVHRRAREG